MYNDEPSFGCVFGAVIGIIVIVFAILLTLQVISVNIEPYFRHKQYTNIQHSESYIVTHVDSMRGLYNEYMKLERNNMALAMRSGNEELIAANQNQQQVYVTMLIDEADKLEESDIPQDLLNFINACREGNCLDAQ